MTKRNCAIYWVMSVAAFPNSDSFIDFLMWKWVNDFNICSKIVVLIQISCNLEDHSFPLKRRASVLQLHRVCIFQRQTHTESGRQTRQREGKKCLPIARCPGWGASEVGINYLLTSKCSVKIGDRCCNQRLCLCVCAYMHACKQERVITWQYFSLTWGSDICPAQREQNNKLRTALKW